MDEQQQQQMLQIQQQMDAQQMAQNGSMPVDNVRYQQEQHYEPVNGHQEMYEEGAMMDEQD